MVLATQAANNFTREKHVVINMSLDLQKFTTHGQKKKDPQSNLKKQTWGTSPISG